MRITASLLPRLAAGLALAISIATSAPADSPLDQLNGTVADIEQRLGARVGLTLIDTGSDRAWTHRADERFLMNSTMKLPLCGAILARRDAGTLSLDDRLAVRVSDILDYAPVTELRTGEDMTLDELCLAALDQSDNTAANLLIARLGGPQAVTDFLRDSGDDMSRLDRLEPKLNTFAADDPRDTTTPRAMADTLRTLFLGDVLSAASRRQLAEWTSHGAVTGKHLRRVAPADWAIFDKSGAGNQTRNLVAMIAPEGHAPWIVTLFISDAEVDFATRDAALQDLSAAVVAVIKG